MGGSQAKGAEAESAIKDFRRAEVQLWLCANRGAFECPRTHPGIRMMHERVMTDEETYMEVAVGIMMRTPRVWTLD